MRTEQKETKDDDNDYKLKQFKKLSVQEEVRRNRDMFDQMILSTKANKQYMGRPLPNSKE